jgi:hypothetical protein
MSAEHWWVQQPPHINMTDARARALLTGRADSKNNDEWVFIQANASTIIPKEQGFRLIPQGVRLSLHKPKSDAPIFYGEKED